MVVAVDAHLVAGFEDVLHQVRSPLRHPAEHEEGGLDVELVQQPEEPPGVRLDPLLHRPPVGRIDDVAERLDVEVVLDVDAEGADDVGSWLIAQVDDSLGHAHRAPTIGRGPPPRMRAAT